MISINDNDPCAAVVTLRTVYANLVGGMAAQGVSFQAGPNGVKRETTFHKADPAALLALIRQYENRCAALSGGRPRRFGMRAGGAI
jgi:hypothetical protein